MSERVDRTGDLNAERPLTAYEERELAVVIRHDGGSSSALTAEERRQLLDLLVRAGCRGFMGLGLNDVSPAVVR